MPINAPIKKRADPGESKQRRSGLELDFEILSAIQAERNGNERRSRLTRIQGRVYLSWNALKKHLVNLEKNGLIAKDELRVTPDGNELLHRYRKEFRPMLKKYRLLALAPGITIMLVSILDYIT
jgi:predicted transcriptional regulator